jgi:hypothetical protein
MDARLLECFDFFQSQGLYKLSVVNQLVSRVRFLYNETVRATYQVMKSDSRTNVFHRPRR